MQVGVLGATYPAAYAFRRTRQEKGLFALTSQSSRLHLNANICNRLPCGLETRNQRPSPSGVIPTAGLALAANN